MEGGNEVDMPRSGNVDERIVEMRLDNKNFESGAKTTISTLEKLEKALKMKSATSSLNELEKSIDKFDASNMTRGLEKVQMSFSALEVMGLRVISNLTDSLYGFTTKMVKSLSVDQVTAGWNKYEKMIESTQTIMAATASQVGEGLTWANQEEQMADIQKYLDGLLWYADETSYSFTDMTDNLGKFLSAGRDLETSYKAMMGIASWGATAGAKPAEVSRALYNISQAMGTGAMKAIDWKSIENANMATLDFKNNAIATAKELGKLYEVTNDVRDGFVGAGVEFNETGYIMGKTDEEVEKMLVTAENFRDSLSSGWLDTDVMEAVFEKYGRFAELLHQTTSQNYGEAVTSAFNASGEAIQGLTGSLLEATDMLQLLEEYRDSLADPSKSVDWEGWSKEAGTTTENLKGLVKALDDVGIAYSETGFKMGQEAKTFTDAIEATKDAVSSQWMKSFQYIFGDYMQAKEFWTNVTSELWDIFAAGGARRNQILKEWSRTADELGRTGRDYLLGKWSETIDGETVEVKGALWNLLDAVRTITTPIKEAFASVFGLDEDKIQSTADMLRALTKRFHEFTQELGFSEQAQAGIKKVFTGIFTVLKTGIKVGAKAVQIFGQIAMVFGNVLDSAISLTSALGDLITGKISFEEFSEQIQDFYKSIKESAKNVLQSLLPTEEQLLGFYERIKNKYEEVKAILREGVTWENIKKILPSFDGISEKLTNLVNYLQNKYPKIFAMFDEWKKNHSIIGGILDSLSGGFSKLDEFLKSIHINTQGIRDVFSQLKTIVSTVFGAIFGDPKEFQQKVATFFSSVWEGLKMSLDQWTPSDFLKAIRTAGFTVLLAEIGQILAGFRKMQQEFTGIPQALSGLIGRAGDFINNYGKQFKANAYIKMAAAVAILAGSLWLLSKVPKDRLTDVAVSLAMLLGVITLFARSLNGMTSMFGKNNTQLSGNKITLFSSFASILIGFGLLLGTIAVILAIAKKTDTSILIGVAIGVIALLGALSLMAKKMSQLEFKDSRGVIVSLLGMSLALQMILPVLAVLALIPPGTGRYLQAVLGVVGLFATLGALAVCMSKFVTNAAGLKTVATSMILMSVALDALLPVLLVCAALSASGLGRGLVGLLAMMTALAAMSWAMSKIKINGKNFVLLAAGIAILAAAMNLMIAPMMALTAALTAFVFAIPWKQIISDLGGFKKAFVKLAALAGIAFIFGAAIALAGSGMFLFGSGLMLAAVGAAALSVVLIPLSAAIPAFINAINSVESIDYSKLLKIAGAFAVMGIAIAAVVFALSRLLKGGLGGRLATFTSGLMTRLGGIGSQVSEKIKLALPTILEVLGSLLIMAGLYFMGIIPELTEIVVQSIIELFNSVANSVETHRADFVDSVMRIIQTFLGVAGDILGKLFDDEWLSTLTPTERGLLNVLKLLAGIKILADGIKLAKSFAGVGTMLGGGGAGGSVLAGAGGAAGGKVAATAVKPLISSLADLKAAAALGGEALAGMSIEAGGSVLAFGSLTAVGAGLLAALGLIPVAMLDNKLAADYTAKAMDDVGGSVDGLKTKAVELANTWKEGEAALYDYTGATTVSYQEGRYAQEALASMLGITTGELEKQMNAANGDVTQIQAMKDAIQQYSDVAATATDKEEALTEKQWRRKQASDEVAMSAGNASSSAQAAMQNIAEQATNGELSLEQFKQAIDDIGLSFDSLGQDIDLTSLIASFTEKAAEIPAGGGLGIESNTDAFTGAIDSMTGEGLYKFLTGNGIASPSTVYAAAAMNIPAGIGMGIQQGSDNAIQAIVALSGNMLTSANEFFTANGGMAGANAVIGIANGVYANLSIAYDAGVAAGNAFMAGYDSATDTHSPSREMMKRGAYAIEGLLIGLQQNEDDVYSTSSGIGFEIVGILQSAMAQIAMMASDKFEFNPVITPVVDMTNIEAAAGSVRGAFGNSHIGLSGEITNSVGRRVEQAERVASNMETVSQTVNNNGDNITFNIYAYEGMDENMVADAVMAKMQTRMVRRGAAFG